MSSKIATAIYDARLAAGLTQEQLGLRLGLKARAIGRWEAGLSVPRKRHRAPLIKVIRGGDAAAADLLAATLFDSPPVAPRVRKGRAKARSNGLPERGHLAPVVAPPVQPVVQPSMDPDTALELAVMRLADELDLPPRRVRGPLVRWLGRVRDAGLSVEGVQSRIETWIAKIE